ncbi:MAG: HypC/HybG/HupF family hydrogenase formation chaperone [Deltaproteobacteria bacterium]|nr:HypC/HybG/HupF family hydrogenase formation chaperone [Deltaproteobacteria bacterium]MBW2420282.1 HypC/HybG/HupF family hydrogenase formation chaperone [Deltaproteobacteria bacterium]
MCLAIPMRVVERREFDGTAEVGGVRRQISMMLCPDARQGDFVLVHAGYAISEIDEEEALRTLALIEEALGREVFEEGGLERQGALGPGAFE